jgi:hypothetical protein
VVKCGETDTAEGDGVIEAPSLAEGCGGVEDGRIDEAGGGVGNAGGQVAEPEICKRKYGPHDTSPCNKCNNKEGEVKQRQPAAAGWLPVVVLSWVSMAGDSRRSSRVRDPSPTPGSSAGSAAEPERRVRSPARAGSAFRTPPPRAGVGQVSGSHKEAIIQRVSAIRAHGTWTWGWGLLAPSG